MTRPDPARNLGDRHTAIVHRIIDEIVEDVRHGELPCLPATFAELHEHVDANTYGGMCDENADIDTESWIDMQEAVQDWLISKAVGRVETWLADHTSDYTRHHQPGTEQLDHQGRHAP